jgi:hypothetical protein
MEKEIGRVVKVFKLDNGKEFISRDFTRYCEDNGIKKNSIKLTHCSKMESPKGKIVP